MDGMKNRLIKILEEERLLSTSDIKKITTAFDEEINLDSTTTKHLLKDIEYMKASSKLLNGNNDPKMILAQDTIPVRFYYEIAHKLYTNKEQALGMQIAKKSTLITGAQIYPGAIINSGVMFNHSIGTVIGDTTKNGSNTTIYQNVSLAARKGSNTCVCNYNARHPQIEGGAVIGAGSILLGPITINEGAKVSA